MIQKPKFLEETFNMLYSQQKEKGMVIIIVSLTLGILLLLAAYFLSFTLTESRISKSQEVATKTYYLAEAGINEAIWKLKYDDLWATCFATTTPACTNCSTWSATFVKNTDVLVSNSTTIVTIQNSECGRGRITATSTIALPEGKTAQRVVKTTAYKSLASPTEGAAVFSGGASENIEIKFSKIRVYGNLFSNHNLNIKWLSTVEVNATGTAKGKILAEYNYDDGGSTVSAYAICAKNICSTTSTCECADPEEAEKFQECTATPLPGRCPPKPLATPAVDFDSEALTSFKERALSAEVAGDCQNLCNGTTCYCNGNPCLGNNKCVLDDDDFEDLLWAAGEGGTLTLGTDALPTITYVEGLIELRGGRHLVVNGALVADDNITIGNRYKWKEDQGFSQITINRPTATTASGLLTKRKIDFSLYSSFTTTTITGVVYANDEISLTSMPESFTIKGGIIGRKLRFTSVWQWFNFILDDEIVLYGLGYMIDDTPIVPEYSPIITVEHWEEAY